MISYKLLMIVIAIVITATTCMAYDLFFVATHLSMRYFNTSKPNDPGTMIPLDNITYVVAIDYDPLGKHVYWSDIRNNGSISRAKLNGDDQQLLVGSQCIALCLTLDTASRMMYWINYASFIKYDIERSKLDGTNREKLIGDLGSLEGYSYFPNTVYFALDTEHRKLYWFDEWCHFRANLNGSGIEVVFNATEGILEEELKVANGTALYLAIERLRWLNFTGISVLSDATNKSVIFFNQFCFYGDYIYEETQNSIVKSNKFEMDDTIEEVYSLQRRALKAIKDNNQHGLLLVSDFYSIVEMNTSSCSSEYDYYYYRYYEYYGYFWDLNQYMIDNGCVYKTISISREILIALDYDPDSAMIYYADANSIWSIHRNGTNERALVTSGILSVGDLVVSSETQQLFWTDTNQSVIERLNLADGNRAIIINDNITSPKGIALDTSQRHIYWTDTVLGRIERCSYNGDSRTVIVDGLYKPTTLEMDPFDGLIFLTEFGMQRIHLTNLSDTHVTNLSFTHDKGFFFQLDFSDMSVLGDFFYFTDIYGATGRANLTSNILEYIYFRNIFTALRPYQLNSDCDSTLCANGGTCVTLADGYSCLCQAGFTGIRCDINDFSVETIMPDVGPIAGGTFITVTGQNFPTGQVMVTIGSFAECNISASNTTTLVAITPPADEDYIGKTHPIFVFFVDHEINVSTDFVFQYKPNPSVKSLHPIQTLIRGGVGLTVTGDNFDAVAQPLLKVDVVIHFIRVENNTDVLLNVTTNTYYGECEKRSNVELLCITPDVGDSVTADWIFVEPSAARKRRDVLSLKRKTRNYVAFLYGFGRSRQVDNIHRRQRRDAEVKETLDIYVGVILDGLRKYENLSAIADTKEYGKLILIKAPHFDAKPLSEGIHFKPGQPLDIEGKDVNRISVEDYKVDVGEGHCGNLEITSNKLICVPPQTEPPRAERSRTEGHLIVVHIGKNLEEVVGTLIYPNKAIVLIVIGIISAVIVLSLVAMISICLKRKCPKRQRPTQSDILSDTSSDTCLIRLSSVIPDFSTDGSISSNETVGPSLDRNQLSEQPVMLHLTSWRQTQTEDMRRRRQGSRPAARRQIQSLYPE